MEQESARPAARSRTDHRRRSTNPADPKNIPRIPAPYPAAARMGAAVQRRQSTGSSLAKSASAPDVTRAPSPEAHETERDEEEPDHPAPPRGHRGGPLGHGRPDFVGRTSGISGERGESLQRGGRRPGHIGSASATGPPAEPEPQPSRSAESPETAAIPFVLRIRVEGEAVGVVNQ